MVTVYMYVHSSTSRLLRHPLSDINLNCDKELLEGAAGVEILNSGCFHIGLG